MFLVSFLPFEGEGSIGALLLLEKDDSWLEEELEVELETGVVDEEELGAWDDELFDELPPFEQENRGKDNRTRDTRTVRFREEWLIGFN